MSNIRTLVALMMLIALGSVATADWVPLPGEPVYTLADLISGGSALDINGQISLSDFGFSSFAANGAIKPDADTVFIIPGTNGPDAGILVVGSWTAASGQQSNLGIEFKVTPLDGNAIKDVVAIFHNTSATGDGSVLASETVFASDPGNGEIIDTLEISKQENDGGVSLTDYVEFDPVDMIWITKDISISGGADSNGSGHLSGFFQFYSQVPEPATMSLLALGGLSLIRRKRR